MKTLHHKFVEFIPEQIEDGILYISIQYSTVIHMCICGCGNEVVTPLSPSDWYLTFNGKTISLYPSIGNWNFDCKTHYWIANNTVKIAKKWSDKEIIKKAKKSNQKKRKYFWLK